MAAHGLPRHARLSHPSRPWPTSSTGWGHPPGGPPEQFDALHELIAHEEFCRLGVPGYCDGLGAGFVIGLPPCCSSSPAATRVGRGALRQTIGRHLRPLAGSDVAGLTLLRRPRWEVLHRQRREEVDHKRKLFGLFCHRRCGRTRGRGCVASPERSEGLETKPIQTSYSASAGTATSPSDVKVLNLLGKENQALDASCITSTTSDGTSSRARIARRGWWWKR